MKKSILFSLALLLSISSFAQTKWGVKIGMNTSDVQPDDLLITGRESAQEFSLAVKDAKYGLNVGAFAQIKMGKRGFIQPELLFNTTRTDFELTDLKSATPYKELVTESYNRLELPIMTGFKFGPLRIGAGATTTMNFGGRSDITDVDGFESRFKSFALGWQAGIGLDIWKFVLDFKYEGNLERYGDHIHFQGQDFDFNDREKKVLFSIGWAF